ncbi:MAG: phosphatidate cytidylyltransferase [Verrucomicrobiae bacterium]|nr:phosphatidate cytidylyltransferase [Verrucomicrobiae bacterium]
MNFDPQLLGLFGGILGILVVASVVGGWLARRPGDDEWRATVANLNARTAAWWVMAAVFAGALLLGKPGVIALFGVASFLALREFITLTPTRPADHRTLFWAFFIITPLQYWLIAEEWYGLFSILIPVYVFLFIPVRSAVVGDCERFLERTAKIQWALLLCVYCVSHVPALMTLEIAGYEGRNAELIFYLVVVAQLGDVLQYVWGKTLGRHRIVPTVSPNKTWEGFIGGIASATAIGAALWRITPFTPLQSAGMALAIACLGFAGGLVMSAIKRDRGVKDYGALIEGHGGVMDRMDSLCFAAPVFFHLVRFYFT